MILADHLTLADVTRPDLTHLTTMRHGGQISLMSLGLAHGTNPAQNVYATLGAGDAVNFGDISQGLLGHTLAKFHVKTALIGDAPGFFSPTPTFTFPAPSSAEKLWLVTAAALHHADFVVVQVSGDVRRLDMFVGLTPLFFVGDKKLIFASPVPPIDANGKWSHLTPFMCASGAGRSFLTSDTTQTPGLVAARDVAPTILSCLQIPVPIQMTGAVIRPGSIANLTCLDRQTHLNQIVLTPLFATLGLLGSVVVFGGLTMFLTRRLTSNSPSQIAVLFGLRALSAWPLALLFAPLFPSPSAPIYLLSIAFLTLALAFLPSPTVILSLTSIVIILDGLTGTHLISSSVLSGYALSGIRFYGIGGEYMGILLAGSLLAARKITPRGRILWFLLVIFTLSFPAFGAKAGGAVTASAIFWLASRRLTGKKIRLRDVILGVTLGFALVFLWVAIGREIGTRRTHLETSVQALTDGRFGYIVGIAGRKAAMAARIALRPETLLGLIGLAGIGLAVRRYLWEFVRKYQNAHPKFAAVWNAGSCGCIVSICVNDSGIIAAVLLWSCLILTLLHGIFRESLCVSSPLMSATSESASLSAII